MGRGTPSTCRVRGVAVRGIGGLLYEDATLFGVIYTWQCADCRRSTPPSGDRSIVLANAKLHRTDHHGGAA
jgi:hypothetical protein